LTNPDQALARLRPRAFALLHLAASEIILLMSSLDSRRRRSGGRRRKDKKRKGQRSLKNFLINPRVQGKYVFWATVNGFSLIAIYSILVYQKVKGNYVLLIELAPMTDQAKQQLYGELLSMATNLMLGAGLFVALTAMMAIVLSHRVAGPIYHFRRVFDAVRDGDLTARIHLRPGDEFQKEAESFNEMMDSVSKRVTRR
jgi:methyl-accepting chemotaxis protein